MIIVENIIVIMFAMVHTQMLFLHEMRTFPTRCSYRCVSLWFISSETIFFSIRNGVYV